MGEKMEIGRRIEGWLVRIAQAISSACNFISIRLDYYVEMKQHEFEVRHKTFPKEWFEDDKDYGGNPNWASDD